MIENDKPAALVRENDGLLEQMLMTWGVAALFVLLALWLAWPLLRRWYGRRRREGCIANSGVQTMHNVLLDDGMGGQTFFEWLLLTPTTIRVLITSGRSGIIFAGERMDSWAQIAGKRTVHFTNPLYSLEESLSTLRYHLNKPAIEGGILFIGECSFPKGRPDRVLTPKELDSRREQDAGLAVQPVLEQAWEQLRQKARKVNPATEGYLLPLPEAPAYGRWLLIGLVLLAAAAWLYWRLQG
ncbi:MAG: hypothetical protein OQK40_01555 [Gammaproteobacteria bacterium]|nr:hypothetical protein [Gammaproteobacteria bacterium]